MSRLIRLQTANVKRLQVVEIEPDGSLTVIGGRNAQGKSSVLDSVEYALSGQKAIPAEPIRKGQRKAKTVLTLDNGIVVTRTYTAKGSALVVTKDGAPLGSPQAVLDALCGKISFDPLAYARMPAKQQAETLRKLIGLDTATLDAERARLFALRTEQGRDTKKLQAQLDAAPLHDGAPDAEVSVAELAAEIERRREVMEDNRQKRELHRAAIAEAAEAVDELVALNGTTREKIASHEQQIAELQKELGTMRERLAEDELAEKLAMEVRASTQAEADETLAALVDPDLVEVREQIAGAETTNRKVRENVARKVLEQKVEGAERDLENLTEQIEAIDEKKRELLAAADFPVAGLGFDEDGVTLHGLPLEQAAESERIRLSVAIGFKLNPELRLLLIRDGSALDSQALELIAKMAEEADGQVLLEKVSEDGDGCSVVIEDGRVKDSTEAAAE